MCLELELRITVEMFCLEGRLMAVKLVSWFWLLTNLYLSIEIGKFNTIYYECLSKGICKSGFTLKNFYAKCENRAVLFRVN